MFGRSQILINPIDKNYSVQSVPTRSITRSKVKKIQQVFILHLQNWIGSVQPDFMCYKLIRLRKDHLELHK